MTERGVEGGRDGETEGRREREKGLGRTFSFVIFCGPYCC